MLNYFIPEPIKNKQNLTWLTHFKTKLNFAIIRIELI